MGRVIHRPASFGQLTRVRAGALGGGRQMTDLRGLPDVEGGVVVEHGQGLPERDRQRARALAVAGVADPAATSLPGPAR
jgi:hypothetical protein